MSARCKLKLVESHDLYWNPKAKRVIFSAEYDDTIPDDLRYCDATPTGRFEMICSNPAVLEKLKLGHTYYFDLVEVPPVLPPAG